MNVTPTNAKARKWFRKATYKPERERNLSASRYMQIRITTRIQVPLGDANVLSAEEDGEKVDDGEDRHDEEQRSQARVKAHTQYGFPLLGGELHLPGVQ